MKIPSTPPPSSSQPPLDPQKQHLTDLEAAEFLPNSISSPTNAPAKGHPHTSAAALAAFIHERRTI